MIMLAAFAAQASSAQDTSASSRLADPTKPIRMIVGFSAGGGSDFAARIAGQKIIEISGQPVVIDNRTAKLSWRGFAFASPISSSVVR